MVPIAQLVERPPVERNVTGSNPVRHPLKNAVSVFCFGCPKTKQLIVLRRDLNAGAMCIEHDAPRGGAQPEGV